MSIFDFFTREAGQERRRALEGLLTQFIPPEMRPQLGLLAEANPVVSMERAGQDAQQLFAPDQSLMDRLAAGGRMASNMAAVAAPAMVASRAALPAAQALQEGLTGVSKAVQPFMVDEFGGVRLTRENAPLIGHHNLSPKGVQVASEIGGIPMPSLAISRADYPLTNFGDISLLADPSMVTPSRNVGVWPTDVYTGRQPRGELQFASEKAATAAMKADPSFGHMRDITYWMDSANNFADANEMMKTAQLGVKEGIDPRGYNSMWDYVRDVRSKLGYSAYEDNASMPGFEAYGGVERVLYPQNMFTPSGNRRKPVPYTLGAVMDRMAKEKAYTAGSEGWDYGPGSFRASVTAPFRSMSEIDAARGLIRPADQMTEVKSAFEDAYGSILDDVNAAYTGRGFGEGSEAMRELAQGKNPTWFGNIPAETRANVRTLVDTTRGMPTEYFEAKPRVAYRLGDFPAAIVPDGETQAADLLRSAGVRNILTYGSKEERAELFKRFPELLFAIGGAAAPLGLLAMQPQEEQY